MERVFKKFLGKCWFIYRRPEIAKLIFRQFCADTKTYMRRVISCECALMDMVCPREMTRSKSMPNLRT
jgi:hypothetical protein